MKKVISVLLAFLLTGQIQLFLEGPETKELGTFGTVTIKEKMIGNMEIAISCM